MTSKKNQPVKLQVDKFKEAAREAGADMDEEEFDRTLGDLAKSKPPLKNGKSEETDPGE